MKMILKWFLLGPGMLILGLVGFAGFGFSRVYYGKRLYEPLPPQLPAQLNPPALLIFSKTNLFRDDAALKASNSALAALAKRRGWSAFQTESGAVFQPEALRRFQATVWNNTSAGVLHQEQKAARKEYIENGCGFVEIHGAGGDPRHEWRWSGETLTGAQFKGLPMVPQFQQATIRIEDPTHPATPDLGTKVSATLGERAYGPKTFYSALGRAAGTFKEPLHFKELEAAIAWAAGFEGVGCPQ